MKRGLRSFLALLSMACALGAAPASGQTADAYPSKPIRLIVPYSPGGGADFTARLIAQRLSASLGQQVVVENRAGANGMIGTEAVARAAPDGYTLLYADAGHSINPAVQSQVRYDPVADFAPVTLIASSPQLLVANPSFPASSAKDLLAMPREQSARLAIGTTGQGSGPHLTYELLRLKSGLTLNHVPYKGGGPALADVVAGHIPLVMNSVPACMPHLQAGRIKALAIAAPQRDRRLPDVPTFAELGYPDIVVLNWYAVLAPAGTPAPVVERLAADIGKVLDIAEVKERFGASFLSEMPRGPAAARSLIEREAHQWKDVAKATGVKID